MEGDLIPRTKQVTGKFLCACGEDERIRAAAAAAVKTDRLGRADVADFQRVVAGGPGELNRVEIRGGEIQRITIQRNRDVASGSRGHNDLIGERRSADAERAVRDSREWQVHYPRLLAVHAVALRNEQTVISDRDIPGFLKWVGVDVGDKVRSARRAVADPDLLPVRAVIGAEVDVPVARGGKDRAGVQGGGRAGVDVGDDVSALRRAVTCPKFRALRRGDTD